jgi:hypothetical protein
VDSSDELSSSVDERSADGSGYADSGYGKEPKYWNSEFVLAKFGWLNLCDVQPNWFV